MERRCFVDALDDSLSCGKAVKNWHDKVHKNYPNANVAALFLLVSAENIDSLSSIEGFEARDFVKLLQNQLKRQQVELVIINNERCRTA